MMGYGNGYGMMGYGWFGIGHTLFLVLSIFLLVMTIKMGVRWMRSGSVHGQPWEYENKALTILKERYAKGEIDKNEFDEKKHELRK